MNFAAQLGAGVRAKFSQLKGMWFTRAGGGRYGGGTPFLGVPGMWLGTLPGTGSYDMNREVGDPSLNGAVSIGLEWINRQFPEPEFQVVSQPLRARGGVKKETVKDDHPLTRLLQSPNAFYDGDALWSWTVVSYLMGGNAYWYVARGSGGAGEPLELWPLPYWQIAPRWKDDGSQFIGWYDYWCDGAVTEIPAENIVHFAHRMSPITRRGMSPIYPVLRSVGADNEADTFTFALLKNMGIPGVLITPKDPKVTVRDPDRQIIKQNWEEDFTGHNRGKAMVASVAVDALKLAFTPEEMALDKIRNVPEDRICAALGLSAMVLGLTSGAQAKTYANYEEANRAAYRDCIFPLQKRLARTLDRQLLPYLGDVRKERCRWCYDDVQGLQEGVDAQHIRVREDYKAGLIMRNEARAELGLPPVAEDEEGEGGFGDALGGGEEDDDGSGSGVGKRPQLPTRGGGNVG